MSTGRGMERCESGKVDGRLEGGTEERNHESGRGADAFIYVSLIFTR
jgi:hypothetical protein